MKKFECYSGHKHRNKKTLRKCILKLLPKVKFKAIGYLGNINGPGCDTDVP